ncbi:MULTISPECIES: hypothetical protein [unclassified Haladaptatus]|uniref:DUF7543 family protein n=1 Tax=unclassified Haladaptatus TaxID=2622732 RepID=UPI0023E7D7DE|nr:MULTISPECIES: hypothetical protein [unclassified Haladaptatus]
MSWTERDPIGSKREWRRDDGYATISLRQTRAGDWAVSFDRLIQAPEGEHYRHEMVATETAANDLVADWKARFDVQ